MLPQLMVRRLALGSAACAAGVVLFQVFFDGVTDGDAVAGRFRWSGDGSRGGAGWRGRRGQGVPRAAGFPEESDLAGFGPGGAFRILASEFAAEGSAGVDRAGAFFPVNEKLGLHEVLIAERVP